MILFRNKALVISLAAAALWHLFWISAIKVVIVPEDVKVVRFPKVSFLGPVAAGRVLEVRTELVQRSPLEDALAKYNRDIIPRPVVIVPNDFAKGFFDLTDEEHSRMVSDAIAYEKSSP